MPQGLYKWETITAHELNSHRGHLLNPHRERRKIKKKLKLYRTHSSLDLYIPQRISSFLLFFHTRYCRHISRKFFRSLPSRFSESKDERALVKSASLKLMGFLCGEEKWRVPTFIALHTYIHRATGDYLNVTARQRDCPRRL